MGTDSDFGIHDFYGGAYTAELSAAGKAFTVTHLIDASGAAPLARPSAPTDAAILQVKWTTCTGSSTAILADASGT